MNTNEPIPEIFYVFVDQTNFVTQHNLSVTKSFSSGTVFHWNDLKFIEKYVSGKVDYLPFIINQKKDVNAISAFENSLTSEYRTEYNAEMHRFYNYPHYPSRLSAVYAFGDIETCKKVASKYKWNLSSVKQFKIIDNPLNKVVKVNMEIVSLDRYAQRVSFCDSETIGHIWNSYWNGTGNIQMELPTINGRQVFNSDEIWEYLIEGQIQVIE
ncbi:hypothetical protein [Niabella ginsengisoli]|uniref:DUF2441 domain-containing protein n=1 Tax=Niabella ginsengisoli TaxID=522298 RepID=A0ABS9SIK6_9BACT|nr:hypothetical protein [Niabella ginsengisoli]MCH5598198.1 hypothetical protein [Niabella ginsengisoli]